MFGYALLNEMPTLTIRILSGAAGGAQAGVTGLRMEMRQEIALCSIFGCFTTSIFSSIDNKQVFPALVGC